jgi:hypothetical protein
VHNDGCARKKFLDFADDLKVQALLAFELVRAMACAYGSGQRIAARLDHELDSFFRVGQVGVTLVDLHIHG